MTIWPVCKSHEEDGVAPFSCFYQDSEKKYRTNTNGDIARVKVYFYTFLIGESANLPNIAWLEVCKTKVFAGLDSASCRDLYSWA